MEEESPQLKTLLVDSGLISSDRFSLAEKKAKEANIGLSEYLVEEGLISDEHLGRIIADHFRFPFVDLKRQVIPQEIVSIIPELVARSQQIIVFDRTNKGLSVAMADPSNFEMIEWLRKKTREKIVAYYATAKDIKDAFRSYQKDIGKTFNELIQEQANLAKSKKAKAEELPIIKIVDMIVKYAYENRASDIHISPMETGTQVRFRIDGILHNVLVLPKDIHGLIITRIKVMAKLRTDEHFSAQDGKFSLKIENEKFDIRISIVPITEGENAVMRLLSSKARRFSLDGLGFSDSDFEKIRSAAAKPYGMILSTGPTGSGKTTTLYAVLEILNHPDVNICTIEDPVEYEIEGISQIQVNNKKNLTFSQGLRSIVRQDPDIIMVGEIRDNETAGIAINSAMTGHLVLSTMHANTAATNIPRLMDMGIEPFLVSSSVNIVIGQRLVRKICTKCRESYQATKEELKKKGVPEFLIERIFRNKKFIRLYRGRGCNSCVNTGYFGRVGIFEALEMSDNIQKLIIRKATADEIQDQAVKEGMTTMLEDGAEKALRGITTIEEVIRAAWE
ncbi:MAG: GspE/PulE family protein [Candidatus Paceibacterota bacterium]|jgi:type IV pilus assembly protein PilB|nr:GspE/PulE family protein [Candidatus Paceibacterota bacterium]MDD4875230.1 GspE/PulE family protein [Candidatus Paceibacterota bacterium]